MYLFYNSYKYLQVSFVLILLKLKFYKLLTASFQIQIQEFERHSI